MNKSHGTKDETFTFLYFCCCCLFTSPSNHLPGRMATAHPLLPHLKAISEEPPSCTLITMDGSRLEVQLLMPNFFDQYACLNLHIFSKPFPFLLLGAVTSPFSTQPFPCHTSCTSWTHPSHLSSMLQLHFKVIFSLL